MRYKEISDEEILSMGRVSVKVAASYLCMPYGQLIYGLQNGRYSEFGLAAKPNSRWTYTIFAKRLVKYKHGETSQIKTELKELIDGVTYLTARLGDAEAVEKIVYGG